MSLSLACSDGDCRLCTRPSCTHDCHAARFPHLSTLPKPKQPKPRPTPPRRAPSPPRAPGGRTPNGVVADTARFDDDGRRVCPDCGVVLVKKDPLGRGRYPKQCDSCAGRSPAK